MLMGHLLAWLIIVAFLRLVTCDVILSCNLKYANSLKLMTFEQEVARRRTFAIISHPDAGKTTITEKILWLGGVIREAGEVHGKSGTKKATSDWMTLEQQRG